MGRMTGFQDVSSRYDGVQLEEEVLALWREHDMFNEAQRQSEGRPLYCWNEGPPTANGRPGIHHVLARTFKDIFPRFKHMQGYHCPRKAGWDTHGLPVEHEIEKELGIFDKAEIERQVGVAEFTRRCRESVMRYIGDWERMTERMGFWVNMGDAYYTLDNSFIESVWWLLRQIWDKGLIYQGYKVVPYDPRIGATLSSHEVALGYKEIEDPSIFVRFPVEGMEGTAFLVWTTTPWTLPSNLALAVHPEVDYVHVRSGGETLILAEALVGAVLRDAEYTIEKRVKGTELEGMRYTRLFDYLPADGPICRVWAADFVTIEDGTGIVHCAPAYGEDDIRLCQAKGLPVVHGVGLDGCFLPEVEPVAGKFFKDADPILVADLEERGLMYRSERYLHNYPHGWRTGDPLIYYAKHAWYIGTSRIRDRMVELNQTINWVPETIRDGRFGNWLANNVDWALSRERFWGTPLPVWTDGDGDFKCIGSIAELESLCGRNLDEVDLHRPSVDEITFVHPDNGRTYRRVPEVIDCWFDSGAMSYAQFHYPFENSEQFENRFPADYICEAIDQTRGWFYSLHAIAALVSDSVAYRNCICLAHIVDKNGRKMSKTEGNIVDPYDVFDHVGADPPALVSVLPHRARGAEAHLRRLRARRGVGVHQHLVEYVRVLRDVREARSHRRRRRRSACRASRDRPLGARAAAPHRVRCHGCARGLRRLHGGAGNRVLRRPAQQLVRASQPAEVLEGRGGSGQAGRLPHALRVPAHGEPADGADHAVHHRDGAPEPRARSG